jgi:DsbC/DsbD-like thiol-disulfide interchange protein
LGEGWKTYWRIPGESGVPPEFDWSRSQNLKSVAIGWPAPRRYRDAAGETIGYVSHVVFPLRAEPIDAAKPVDLALSLFYAVCKDICIPAEAELALRLSPGSAEQPADKQLLESFAARIPSPPGSSLLPGVESLRVAASGDDPVLEVELKGLLPVETTDIFIEGHPQAHFRKPQPAQPGPEASNFHLRIDGLDDVGKLRGSQLTVTLVSGPVSLVQSLAVE